MAEKEPLTLSSPGISPVSGRTVKDDLYAFFDYASEQFIQLVNAAEAWENEGKDGSEGLPEFFAVFNHFNNLQDTFIKRMISKMNDEQVEKGLQQSILIAAQDAASREEFLRRN